MGYILIEKETNEVNGKSTTMYSLYSTVHDKIYKCRFEDILRIDKSEQVNFRFSSNGKRIISKGMGCKPSIVENGVYIEKRPTLISVDDDLQSIVIITTEKVKQRLSLEEYRQLRKTTEINNEYLDLYNYDKMELILKRYCSREITPDDHIYVVDKSIQSEDKQIGNTEDNINDRENQIGNTEDNTKSEEKQIVNSEEDWMDDTQEESDDTVNDTSKHSLNNTNTSIKEEIEKVENKCQSDGAKNNTDDGLENTPEEKDIDINYKNIIWNMYPDDRITIPLDKFKEFSYVITKVLDSDMDGNTQVTLCKIFKQVRTKCTFALVKIDYVKEICTIQVIGQSDIPEKAMHGDIVEYTMKFAKWLSESRFIKVG